MTEAKFVCSGCGTKILAGDAHYRTRKRPKLCFLCAWVREFEPDPTKWDEVRAWIDRE
jgi:hypothetical protein